VEPLTKGANFVMLVRGLRARRERAQALLPPHLQKYLHERILPTRWYPEADFVEALAILAKIDKTTDAQLAMLGRLRADEDVRGAYESLLRRGDALRTLEGAAVLWRSYHNTGEVSVRGDGARSATVVQRGFPIRSRELCAVNIGFLEGLVEASGATSARGTHSQCICDGFSECVWRLRWS
jgi:hypothetical protein